MVSSLTALEFGWYGQFWVAILDDIGSDMLFWEDSRNVLKSRFLLLSWSIQPGTSCERLNPGLVSNLSSTWDYSTLTYGNGDMGTPGDQNSVYVNSFAQNSWAFIKAFVQ